MGKIDFHPSSPWFNCLRYKELAMLTRRAILFTGTVTLVACGGRSGLLAVGLRGSSGA
jgi:hypothetical protein